MVGKCSNPDCVAPTHCHIGNDNYSKCEFWLTNNAKKKEGKLKPVKKTLKTNLNWTGEPFKIEDVSQVTSRTNAVFIGIVGKADSGKTTFLAMLYTLLLNGKKLKDYDFAGTKTIIGWDTLYHKLKVLKNKVAFPDPTPSQYYRLLHFSLRNKKHILKDIFFSDASGEVFTIWSHQREDINAANARWIYESSDGFILFIDCQDLIDRMNVAKTEIIDIAQMLKHNLKERPVIAVWSKADKKQEVHNIIKTSLSEELKILFSNYSEIDISNFSKDDPDEIVHDNNIEVVNWLLERIFSSNNKNLIIPNNYENNMFLNFKGK